MKREMVTLRNDNKDWIDGYDKQQASKAKSCDDEILRLKAKIDSFGKQLKKIGSKFLSNTGELEVSHEDIHPTIDELKQQYASETKSHENETLRLKANIESPKNQLAQDDSFFQLKLKAKENQRSLV